jgi:hypothetical protein
MSGTLLSALMRSYLRHPLVLTNNNHVQCLNYNAEQSHAWELLLGRASAAYNHAILPTPILTLTAFPPIVVDPSGSETTKAHEWCKQPTECATVLIKKRESIHHTCHRSFCHVATKHCVPMSLPKMRWHLEIAMCEGTTENAALVTQRNEVSHFDSRTPFLDAPGDPWRHERRSPPLALWNQKKSPF